MEFENIKRILIIKPSALGDIVHCLPTLHALRNLYPDAYFSWLVFGHFADILKDNPDLDEVLVWEKKPFSITKLLKLANHIRKMRYDLVVDLQGLARTAIISLISGARYRLGVPGLRELSYLFEKEIYRFDPKQHAVERNLRVVEYLGGKTDKKIFLLGVTEQEKQSAEEFLKSHGFRAGELLAGISASAGIPQKCWPKEYFARLCDRLVSELRCKILFIGSEKDLPVVSSIRSLMQSEKGSSINACGRTDLRQLVALIKQCSMFVANDTGPLHIAAALGVIPVGLYGPSNPDQLAPYHKDAVVFYKGIKCAPCGISPRCRSNECMKLIKVEDVFDAIRKKLT